MTEWFGDSTGLYFYSAVFQGNMALLALTGVFVVFRLQQLSLSIQEKDRTIETYVRMFCNRALHAEPHFPLFYEPACDYPRVLEEIISDTSHNDAWRGWGRSIKDNKTYRKMWDERASLNWQLQLVVASMKKPFCWTLVVCGLSLVLLPVAKAIPSVCYLEPLLFLLTVALNDMHSFGSRVLFSKR